MSYLDDHLLPGEQIVHRARLHRIIFAWSAVCFGVGVVLGAYLRYRFPEDAYWLVGAVLVVLGAILMIDPMLRYASSDFAVTDKRVLAKYGLVRRRSLETLLTKVEAIGVEQNIAGRLLGYGTISITGTGGTREILPMIAAPLEFRRQVQAQIVVLEARAAGRGAAPVLNGVRAERDCPYCAEPILVKAKICKHCGLDVA
jgi:membrane protein YdbS with pleckstrin-like domain